jgi:hypothetical protein
MLVSVTPGFSPVRMRGRGENEKSLFSTVLNERTAKNSAA